MARRSSELAVQCQQFGLPAGGTREQMMDRLRDHFIQRDSIKALPQIDVMTAQNAKDLLDYELVQPWRSPKLMEMWNSDSWVVEPKLDGLRVKAHFHPKYPTQPRLDSRRRSDVDYIYAEKTENFPHLAVPNPPEDTILDGEMMPPVDITKIWNGAMWIEGLQISTSIWNSGDATSLNIQRYSYPEGPGYWVDEEGKQRGCLLNYHAFDILRFKSNWVHDKPYAYRRALLQDVVLGIREQNPLYHIVPVWGVDSGWCQEGTLDWDNPELGRLGEYEQLVAGGGEGVMFKYRLSPYEFGKRSWSWLKLKKFTEISAFITGYVPANENKAWKGLVGAFEVSLVRGGEPVHVASVSAMTLEMRKLATAADGTLNPAFLNRVIEVRFQCMTTRSFRGRHAVMIRFRDDQRPEDCTFDQYGVESVPSEMMDE